MKRASDSWEAPSCAHCGGGLTRSACGALCRTCIDNGVRLHAAPEPKQTDWLDGVALESWLRHHGLFNRELQLGERLSNRVGGWKRRGVFVSVWDADEVLTKLDLHLSELPAEMWVEPTPATSKRRYCEQIRPEVVERHREGESASALAQEYGIDPVSVWKWAKNKNADLGSIAA